MRLVIDASVLKAAGSEAAEAECSRRCREFLSAVLRICHQIVGTAETHEEWKWHKSPYASGWLTEMVRRGKLHKVGQQERGIRRRIRALKDASRIEPILKDIHLFEAAIASNRIIISLDETAKNNLKYLIKLRAIKSQDIAWVNPSRDENLSEWLESGATEVKKFIL